jgi:type II secretion system-associated lipoprotein
MKKTIIAFTICILFTVGCSTFIPDEDVERLSVKYQSGDYILLQDVTRNDLTLAKGTVVKLIFVAGDEWVKIYAYDKKEELLTSKRQLLVYMFEDDFPGEEFNHELLESELLKIAQLYNSSAIELKQQKGQSVKKIKK